MKIRLVTGTKVKKQLDRLKAKAFCRYEVSGTVFDPLLKGDINWENIVVMDRPENYKGVNNFTQINLPNPSKLTTYKNGDVFTNDPNFSEYIKEMSTRELNEDEYKMMPYDECHPIICLARVALPIEPNKKVLVHMKINYPEIPSMFFCSDGLYVSINITNKIILENKDMGKKVKFETEEDGELPGDYLLFKKSSPGELLTWLYNNGGVEKFPRIFICAGVLAGRSISFGASNYDECHEENKLWWHLSEQYVCISDKMDTPELLQLARLSGNYKDNLKLRFYASKKTNEDMLKAFHLQDEFVSRVIEKEAESVRETITNMPIYKKKVPTKKLTKKVLYKLNKKSDIEVDLEDGGWAEDKYICEDHSTGIKINPINAVFNELIEVVSEREERRSEVPITLDLSHFETLTNKSFPRWAKANTKIATFMKNLDPIKEYSEREIKDLCRENHINGISLVMNERINNTNAYGKIIRKTNNIYQLYPELVEEFNKYF